MRGFAEKDEEEMNEEKKVDLDFLRILVNPLGDKVFVV